MGREQDRERRFSEDLDRILAGEDVQTDDTTDKELIDTLDFARKMSELRAVPSMQYTSRLKARLLQKLEEKEAQAKQRQGWFWNLLRSRPVWQIAIVVLLVAAAGIVWRTGVLGPVTPVPSPTTVPAVSPTPATVPAPLPPAGRLLSVDARTDKSSYQPGEKVNIELSMRNVSPERLTIDKFPPIVSLMQSDTRQPVYTISGVTAARTLASSEVARVTLTWDQVDFKDRPVTGSFYIELEDLEYMGHPIQLNLSRPVRFEITPDGSAPSSSIFPLNSERL